MEQKGFWYWVKYAVNNGGRIEHEGMGMDFWGHHFSKISIYVGKTELLSRYKSELPIRFNWIEKL